MRQTSASSPDEIAEPNPGVVATRAPTTMATMTTTPRYSAAVCPRSFRTHLIRLIFRVGGPGKKGPRSHFAPGQRPIVRLGRPSRIYAPGARRYLESTEPRTAAPTEISWPRARTAAPTEISWPRARTAAGPQGDLET